MGSALLSEMLSGPLGWIVLGHKGEKQTKKHRQFQKLSFMIDPPPEPVFVNVLRSPGIDSEVRYKKNHRQFQKISFMIDPPPDPVFVNVLRSPGIDSAEAGNRFQGS